MKCLPQRTRRRFKISVETRMFFPCCVYQPKGNLGLPKIAVLTGALAIGLVGGASAQTTGLRLNPTI
jgi:hypothetical protein